MSIDARVPLLDRWNKSYPDVLPDPLLQRMMPEIMSGASNSLIHTSSMPRGGGPGGSSTLFSFLSFHAPSLRKNHTMGLASHGSLLVDTEAQAGGSAPFDTGTSNVIAPSPDITVSGKRPVGSSSALGIGQSRIQASQSMYGPQDLSQQLPQVDGVLRDSNSSRRLAKAPTLARNSRVGLGSTPAAGAGSGGDSGEDRGTGASMVPHQHPHNQQHPYHQQQQHHQQQQLYQQQQRQQLHGAQDKQLPHSRAAPQRSSLHLTPAFLPLSSSQPHYSSSTSNPVFSDPSSLLSAPNFSVPLPRLPAPPTSHQTGLSPQPPIGAAPTANSMQQSQVRK
ncbi:hypothetical protein DUNSADRAFT_13890 [Dunaliella salina]|uniref:Uncharacterized protein n=1 Tax=Dunaliella salina TaxID=3046 RepID=A0ABQ7G8H5_DUNSA|nr:hypothetical protein DUNSADRAFT_13890 [Dunaliella salina]|eukprot:KAF5830902.1 hypothetical protein DUNSADRAFT_13890 [Dunaliella salina]